MCETEPVAAYLTEWLERRRTQLRPTTHKSYAGVVTLWLNPAMGDVLLTQLDRRRVEAAYAQLLERGGRGGRPLSPRSVQYAHAVLHRALKDAVIDGLIAANPAAVARPPRHDPDMDEVDDDMRVWSVEEVRRFLRFVDTDPLRPLWYAAVGTGMRRGELLGLAWRDTDLAAGVVRVRRALTVVAGVPRLLRTKTSRSRTIGIGPSVVEALSRHQAEQQRRRRMAAEWLDRWDLVFTDASGRPLVPQAVTDNFRRLVRRAPVPIIRLHDVRHTHASLMLQAGVPAKVVSDRLGHATVAMTLDVYTHVMPVVEHTAIAAFERLLDSTPAQ